MPVSDFSISPDRWFDAPLPNDAKLSAPGLLFRERDQRGGAVHAERRVDDEQVRDRRDQRDRLEVALGVERQLRVEAGLIVCVPVVAITSV
jgi:hypothetical protein